MAKARRPSTENLDGLIPNDFESGTWNANASNFTGVATSFLSVTGNFVRIGNMVWCWGNGDVTFSGNGDYSFDLILPVTSAANNSTLRGLFNRTAGNIIVAGSIAGTGSLTHAQFLGNNQNGAGTRGTNFMFNYRIV